MSNPNQQNPSGSLDNMSVESIESLNINYGEFNDSRPIQQELFLNSRKTAQLHKPNINYNSGQTFYLPQQNLSDSNNLINQIHPMSTQNLFPYQNQQNFYLNQPNIVTSSSSSFMGGQMQNQNLMNSQNSLHEINLQQQQLNLPPQLHFSEENYYSPQQLIENQPMRNLEQQQTSNFNQYNQVYNETIPEMHTYQQQQFTQTPLSNSYIPTRIEKSYQPSLQQQYMGANLTSSNASSVYLPTVGSTCTIETSTSPPPQQQQTPQLSREIYEYEPEESFIHEEIVTTSMAPPNQINLQQRYSVKILPPTTTVGEIPQVKKPLPKRPKVTTVVPEFEEEDYEDEDEEINPQKVQRRHSSEKMAQSPKSPFQKISPSPLNKISGSPASTSFVEPLPPIKKQSRKQELPSFGKKETLTSHLLIDNKPKQTLSIAAPIKSKTTNTKAKKEILSSAVNKEVASKVSYEQKVGRIATMEGWKRMYEWIKAAEKDKDYKKLKTLLAQCSEVEISTDLLSSNDTGKLVFQLAKNCLDKEVSKAAMNLVTKWKKVIGNSKKNLNKVSPEPSSSISAQKPKQLSPQNSTEKQNKSQSPPLTNEVLKNPPEQVPKRPKTAKAKISKPRSTGLEEDEENKMATTLSKRRLSQTSGRALDKTVVKNPHASVHNPLDTISLALENQNTVTPVLPAKNAPVKRSIMLSDNFMDALGAQTVVKKPKIVRKKLNPPPSEPTNTSTFGLFSDTSKNALKSLSNEGKLESGLPEGDVDLPGKRRVRFADEHGAELAEIRTFEIEEGERVNVTRMCSEDMKHIEMQRERTFIREQKSFNWAATELPLPQGFNRFQPPPTTNKVYQFSNSNGAIKWHLYPVDDAQELVERGINSESKLIEFKRITTVMEAFYDSNTTLPISELDEVDYPRADTFQPPKIIPLEVQILEEPVNMTPNQATNVTSSNPNGPATTSAMIQQLPLPSISNLSRLAASLPPAVAALVAKIPSSIALKDDKTPTNSKNEDKKELEVEEDSPMSPTPSEHEEDRKEEDKKIEEDYENFTPKSPDQIDSSMENKKEEDEDPEDVDLRETNDLDDDFGDTDMRFSDALASSALLTSAVAELDEDVDLRQQSPHQQQTSSNVQPAIIPVEPVQKSIPTSSADTVSDVQALLSSLRKSGIMCGADLAGILSKVNYTTSSSGITTTTSSSTASIVRSENSNTIGSITTTTASKNPVLKTPTFSDSPLPPSSTSLPQKPLGFQQPQTSSTIRPFPPSWSANFSNPPPKIRFPAGIPRVGGGLFAANPHPARSPQQQFGMGFPGLTDSSSTTTNIVNSNPSNNVNPLFNASTIIKNTTDVSHDSTSLQTRNASSALLADVPLPNEQIKKTGVFKTAGQTLSTEKDLLPPGVGPPSSPSTSSTMENSIPISSLVPATSSLIEIDNKFGFPQQQQQQDLSTMPMARTFVKQCTYYLAGACHYGESCRFAHGEELTMGVRQAMGTVRGRSGPLTGGSYHGGSRGGLPTSKAPSGNNNNSGGTNSGPQLNAVGGGIEIDYDERRSSGRNRRFTSPLRKGYHDSRGDHRHTGKSSSKYSSRRRRSSSSSVSPIRKSRRSRSRSKSPISSSRRRTDRRRPRDSSRSPRSSRHYRNNSPVGPSGSSSRQRSTRRRSKSPATAAKTSTTTVAASEQRRRRRSVSSSSSSSATGSSSSDSGNTSGSSSKHRTKSQRNDNNGVKKSNSSSRNCDSKGEVVQRRTRYTNEQENSPKGDDSRASEVVLDTPESPELVQHPTNRWERQQSEGEFDSSSLKNTPASPTASSSSGSVPPCETIQEKTLKV